MRETRAGIIGRAAVLPGLALLAWAVAASGRWSWALAVRGLLPADALFLTWFRGPAPVVRGFVALVAIVLTIRLAFRVGALVDVRLGQIGGFVVAPLALVLAVYLLEGPPYYGPRVTFDVIRPELEQALVLVGDVPTGYPGEQLPSRYQALTHHGRVQVSGSYVFFPQWAGIPDDAGGFFHSTSGSPEGQDMWGMTCEAPLRLDDAWWSCGMNEEAGRRW